MSCHRIDLDRQCMGRYTLEGQLGLNCHQHFHNNMHRHFQHLHNEKVPPLLIWIIIDTQFLLANPEKLIYENFLGDDSVFFFKYRVMTRVVHGFEIFSREYSSSLI